MHSNKPKDFGEIIKASKIPEGIAGKTFKLAAAPKSLRKRLIASEPESEEGRIAAAIEIQRAYRGYCTRCRLLKTLDPKISNTAVYGESKHNLQDWLNDAHQEVPPGEGHLREMYEAYLRKMKASGADPSKILTFDEFCATVNQEWGNKQNAKKSSNNKPAAVAAKAPAPKPVQPVPVKRRETPLSEPEASTIIQRAWRRHIDVQVYRYYRDLINFRSRGDPAMMLRCINPNEAKMLDAATGVHIKFRLAGERFPPNIYYKIFTHRPIQDMCANSPKDYTRFGTKRKMARDVHNKGDRIPEMDFEEPDIGQAGWYQRAENNGWRLVSDRLIHHMLSDPVTWETSKRKVEFHHNKLQRKADVERKKKQKKIDWMKKMYREGMLNAKVDDEDTVRLIEGAAAGMVQTIERQGPDAVQDWEVDELLEWTTSLNFEDYVNGWKEVATSANSEKPVDDRLALGLTTSDPYGLTLTRQQPSTEKVSTRQSHNTPVSSQHSMGSVGIY